MSNLNDYPNQYDDFLDTECEDINLDNISIITNYNSLANKFVQNPTSDNMNALTYYYEKNKDVLNKSLANAELFNNMKGAIRSLKNYIIEKKCQTLVSKTQPTTQASGDIWIKTNDNGLVDSYYILDENLEYTNLETVVDNNVKNIYGITSSLVSTSDNVALSANAGRQLQEQTNAINNNLIIGAAQFLTYEKLQIDNNVFSYGKIYVNKITSPKIVWLQGNLITKITIANGQAIPCFNGLSIFKPTPLAYIHAWCESSDGSGSRPLYIFPKTDHSYIYFVANDTGKAIPAGSTIRFSQFVPYQ